jgi:hypothetical protein
LVIYKDYLSAVTVGIETMATVSVLLPHI